VFLLLIFPLPLHSPSPLHLITFHFQLLNFSPSNPSTFPCYFSTFRLATHQLSLATHQLFDLQLINFSTYNSSTVTCNSSTFHFQLINFSTFNTSTFTCNSSTFTSTTHHVFNSQPTNFSLQLTIY